MSAKVCDVCNLPILEGEEHFGNTRFEHTNLRSCIDRLAYECEQKDALIAKLCEALEPFAIRDNEAGEKTLLHVSPADMRRARAALAAAAQARKGETE